MDRRYQRLLARRTDGTLKAMAAEDAQLQDLIKIQKKCVIIDGDVDEYMYGMLNGLVCADAVVDGKEVVYPDRKDFVESKLCLDAKSTLTLDELVAGTRIVDKKIIIDADKKAASVTGTLGTDVGNVKTEIADVMKYIRFAADVDGFKPVVMLFDYVKPEKATDVPVNTWMAGLGLSKVSANDEISTKEHVARVSCTCPQYLAVFAQANYTHDAHQNVRPKKVDARDFGYKVPEPNVAAIPGVCEHLYLLVRYLKQAHRLK